MVRLNKYLATNLGISRREADDLIADGKILVNGNPATLGARIEDSDRVNYNGHEIVNQKLVYIALNKPAGYVCSRKRQGDTPTIYELLPDEMQNLKSVGRLDKDSSGLILLTNDGDFAFKMTHPSFIKTKIYEVRLDRELAPLHQQMISDFGIELADGLSKLGLAKMNDERTSWQVTMNEGRNRQIRRTFDALGYKVVALHRTNFGRYGLDGLAEGKYTEVPRAD